MDRDFIWPSDSSGDEEVEVVYGEGICTVEPRLSGLVGTSVKSPDNRESG